MLVLIFAAALIIVGIVAVVVSKSKKRKEKKIAAAEVSSGPHVIYGKGFEQGLVGKEIKDHDHKIKSILVQEENNLLWICSVCETENPLASGRCCLCHSIKR